MVDKIKPVKISNFCDNETVFHQIIPVKGSVLPEIANFLTIECNGNCVNFVLDDSYNFFAVAELKCGENELSFFDNRSNFAEENIRPTLLRLIYEPLNCDRFLRILYVVLKDETDEDVTSNIELNLSKITLGIKLLQCYVSEELKTKLNERKSFRIGPGQSCSGFCTVFSSRYSSNDFVGLSNDKIYWKFAVEILDRFGSEKSAKYVGFLSCTKLMDNASSSENGSDNDYLANAQFYVNYSVGDVAIINGAGLYSWPLTFSEILGTFLNTKPVPTNKLNDSGGRNTVGGVFATTLGMTMHEIGHLFNLVHSSTGIMSRDFDNIQMAFIGEGIKVNVASQTKCRQRRNHSNCSFINGFVVTQQETCYHFAENALLVMNFHPWFANNYLNRAGNSEIFMEKSCVVSKQNLVYVELRCLEQCINYWDLRILQPKRWIITSDIPVNDNYHLFVVDMCGTMITIKL